MHFAGGALIFGVFIILYFFAFVSSYYTRRGSAINQRPYRNPDGAAPGAARTSSLSHDPRSSINYVRGTR